MHIPDLSDDNWDEILQDYFTTTIAARDRLIQLGIFHRTYYTPLRLFQMNKRDNPDCHNSRGDVLHMPWSCDKGCPFWSHVTHFIATHFDLPNICNPKWCILGVLEDIDLGSYQK